MGGRLVILAVVVGGPFAAVISAVGVVTVRLRGSVSSRALNSEMMSTMERV
jgi:hypothetical protein